MVCAAVWRRVQKVMRQMDERIQSLARDVASVEQQLAGHYEYAGDLGTRLDGVDMKFENVDDSIDASTARIATLEEDLVESSSAIEETLDCIRYGLMEFGGFVRHSVLTREQRSQMHTQERANLVIWNSRHRAETTDVVQTEDGNDFEGGEEERPTTDPVVNPSSHAMPGQLESLLEHMRRDQNLALGSGGQSNSKRYCSSFGCNGRQ